MEIRLAATRYIWVAFAFMMIALFVSATLTSGGLGLAHVILGGALSLAAFLATGTVWNWGDVRNEASASAEARAIKQKRSSVDRLADELDQMNDDDLQRLRTRLSGDTREVLASPAYSLQDDGELIRR